MSRASIYRCKPPVVWLGAAISVGPVRISYIAQVAALFCGDAMRLSEPVIFSFVIRIVIEQPKQEWERVRWQGQITHIPSGEQAYFRNLDAIAVFVASYLDGGDASQISSSRF